MMKDRKRIFYNRRAAWLRCCKTAEVRADELLEQARLGERVGMGDLWAAARHVAAVGERELDIAKAAEAADASGEMRDSIMDAAMVLGVYSTGLRNVAAAYGYPVTAFPTFTSRLQQSSRVRASLMKLLEPRKE